jgi:hypothetical protein
MRKLVVKRKWQGISTKQMAERFTGKGSQGLMAQL